MVIIRKMDTTILFLYTFSLWGVHNFAIGWI